MRETKNERKKERGIQRERERERERKREREKESLIERDDKRRSVQLQGTCAYCSTNRRKFVTNARISH